MRNATEKSETNGSKGFDHGRKFVLNPFILLIAAVRFLD